MQNVNNTTTTKNRDTDVSSENEWVSTDGLAFVGISAFGEET